MVGVLLGGCIGEPEPAPSHPSLSPTTTPPPTAPTPTAPTPTAATPPSFPPPSPTTTAPQTAAVPASSSLRQLKAILELFSQEMFEAGASAVLIKAKVGQEEWSHAAGVRSRDGNDPVQLSDPVQVGGVTQTMVAVSVLKLVDEGRLVLDEPMTKYLPELEQLLHPPEPYSVRRLLNHTSGMPDFYDPLLRSAPLRQVLATPISAQQRLALAGTVPWPKRLGQGFSYSSSNYIALGMIVERLRGKALAEVLQDDILEPLELRDTSMIDDGPAPGRLVHGYTLVDGELVDVAYSPMQSGSASGGMVSTLDDINTFYKALLRGQLLSPARVAEMKGLVYADYGLGLSQWNDTCTNGFYYGHPGDVPGYGTIAISSPDGNRQLAISVAYPPSPLPTRFNAIVLEMADLAEDALNTTCRGLQFRWNRS
jgi:D-alanyl-D-alanine carboxypeptidase